MTIRVVVLLCFFLCSLRLYPQNASGGGALDLASKTIRSAQIRAHMRFLSDSLLQGRAPGTPGYDIAARYVAAELEGMGLHPAVSGSWFQPVPFEKAVTDAAASSLVLAVNGKEQKLVDAKDYVLSARFASPAKGDSKAETDVNAPVVFVGFGVTAPDQKYDDYAGIDVHGKIVASIYGAPSSFPSTERAYYSDGIVKAKNAIEHGAVGVLSITLPEDWKRYPWDWLVPQIQMGDMHWLDKQGIPHDFFPELRGGALFSQKGRRDAFCRCTQDARPGLRGRACR